MILDALRAYARRLHTALRDGDVDLLAYVNSGSRNPVALAEVRRRHVLAAIGRHLGFRGWSHLTAVLDGRDPDHGRLFVPPMAGGFTNIWTVDHAEAVAIRQANAGYVLPWQRQFVVVGAAFVEEVLGLDPADPDWTRVGFDLAQPADATARLRLIDAVMRHRLGEPAGAGCDQRSARG